MGGLYGSTIVWAVSLIDVRVLQNTLRAVATILVGTSIQPNRGNAYGTYGMFTE